MTLTEYNMVRNQFTELLNKLYTEEHEAQAANNVTRMLELIVIERWLRDRLSELIVTRPAA